MANILNSLSKIPSGDVVMSVRDIKKTFVEGGQPLHILRGGGFDLHRGEIIALAVAEGLAYGLFLSCHGDSSFLGIEYRYLHLNYTIDTRYCQGGGGKNLQFIR